jgi:hypothetical protein
MAQGIEVQHSISYVHIQNGFAESLIKRIKLITRPLLQDCNLPTCYWGHAILHVVGLVQLCPTAYHTTFPLQLIRGNQPSISHMRIFGYVVYTSISTQSEPLWALIRNWGSTWNINICPLLNTRNP